jgi:putative FmdB family regulatory protein
MPLYTYECPIHGGFEEIKEMDDREIALCPVCKKTADRVVAPFAFRVGFSPMGRTRGELLANMGKVGQGNRDTWKIDRDQMEQEYRR